MSISTVDRSAAGDRVAEWRQAVLGCVAAGGRFAGLFAAGDGRHCDLTALVATSGRIVRLATVVEAGDDGLRYPALTPDVAAASWYERALHDLSGVLPVGHPRLEPLLLPREPDEPPPRPGSPRPWAGSSAPPERPGPVDVAGRGMFTISYRPVRSGVFESIEYLVETPGEDIPRVNIRPYFKHRGVAKRFEGRGVDDAVLVAERVEGIASVAHAIAFCRAVENLGGVRVPPAAALMRVVFAELERIVNHLDVAMRLAEAAGLSVAIARFGWHKELLMRLVSRLCGSRFGRGVVVPGGVRADLDVRPTTLRADLAVFAHRIRGDVRALMASPSFLDRLRHTGILEADLARRFGALGPIGRASGCDNDVRRERPYDGYLLLPPPPRPGIDTCDAVGRLRVRWNEVESSFALIGAALDAIAGLSDDRVTVPIDPFLSGTATGSAEAPQGEALYDLRLIEGAVRRCFARSASFHNLPLFREVWHGDVKTDFAFIEASFGLSYAAVAM